MKQTERQHNRIMNQLSYREGLSRKARNYRLIICGGYFRKVLSSYTDQGLQLPKLDHASCDVVCTQQIYNEALKEMGKPRNSESREIGLIMNGTISGWIPFPNPRNISGYGK